MKIKHSIIRDGKTLRGYIIDTIFEGVDKIIAHNSQDNKFYICSSYFPKLGRDFLHFGGWKENKNIEVSYTYETEEEAQKILDCINEFTVQEVVENPSEDGDNGVTVSYKLEGGNMIITDIKEERKIFITNITEDNKLEVLKKIEEKYPDVRWYDLNHKPTEVATFINTCDLLIKGKKLQHLLPFEHKETEDSKDYTFITASEFLGQVKEKEEKPQVFVNSYYVGEEVFTISEEKIIFCKIQGIRDTTYILYDINSGYDHRRKENLIYRTKAQLKKHLLKQEEKRHEEEILKINNM